MPKCMPSHGRRSSSNQRCLPWRLTATTRRPSSARWTSAGGSANTMGSAEHATPTMRRPSATRAARRRAASTSGSSGTRGRLLHDLEQLDLEYQRRARLDLAAHRAVAIGEVRRADEAALAAHLHELHGLGPAG